MYNWASYIKLVVCYGARYNRIKYPRANMIHTVLSVPCILLHVILFLIRGSLRLTHNGVRRRIMAILYTCNFALMYTNNQNMGEKKNTPIYVSWMKFLVRFESSNYSIVSSSRSNWCNTCTCALSCVYLDNCHHIDSFAYHLSFTFHWNKYTYWG